MPDEGNNWKTADIPFKIVPQIEEDEATLRDERLSENCCQIFLSGLTQKAHSQFRFHNYFHNSSIHFPSLNPTQMLQSIPNKKNLVFSTHDPHIFTQNHLKTQLGFELHPILIQYVIWPIFKPTEEITNQPQLDYYHTYKMGFYSFYEKYTYSLTTEFFFTTLVLRSIDGNSRIEILLTLDVSR